MKKDAKIYVAGHRGLVGSALVNNLTEKKYKNIITRSHSELELTKPDEVENFFINEKPEYVLIAAAKVGGIYANKTYPVGFIRENISIQTNIIGAAYKYNVKRLLFLGSSCIYPKNAPQPLKEEYLLTGSLEATNRAYALAKIAGIEMCWSYNRQYRTRFLSVMPTNLYGRGDNYDLSNSHVLPALIRKFHEAKTKKNPTVTVWGSGNPRREFLNSYDMADACVYLMNLPESIYDSLLGSDEVTTGEFRPPIVNIGVGKDITIRELAGLVGEIVGYSGNIVFDENYPDGTKQKILDVSLLTKLGWKAKITLREGVKLAYKEFMDNEH